MPKFEYPSQSLDLEVARRIAKRIVNNEADKKDFMVIDYLRLKKPELHRYYQEMICVYTRGNHLRVATLQQSMKQPVYFDLQTRIRIAFLQYGNN